MVFDHPPLELVVTFPAPQRSIDTPLMGSPLLLATLPEIFDTGTKITSILPPNQATPSDTIWNETFFDSLIPSSILHDPNWYSPNPSTSLERSTLKPSP
jgi:hypothetical protein